MNKPDCFPWLSVALFRSPGAHSKMLSSRVGALVCAQTSINSCTNVLNTLPIVVQQWYNSLNLIITLVCQQNYAGLRRWGPTVNLVTVKSWIL